MVQGFERERAAIRSGDLREARRLLVVAATRPLTREQRATQRVTLAEVLLLTAEREEAVRLATLALTESPAPAEQARAHVVRAVAHADAGDLTAALAEFRRGIELARSTALPAEIARAQVRLLATLAERLDDGHLSALAPDVRQNVVRAGDPHLSIHFYLAEGRLAAKLGAIDRAWHHFDLAAALLPIEPNHVIEALYGFAASALCSLTADRTSAVAYGRRALHAARMAGYTRLVPRVLANLAQALVHLGHVDEAEVLLDEGLHQPSVSAEVRVALLDSRVQASLLRRDLAASRQLLARIDAALDQRDPHWDWPGLSRRETIVRVLLANGDHEDAATLAREAREAAARLGDGLHAALFALLEADARLTRGELAEARRLVDLCGGPADVVSLVVAGERERLRARLSVYTADLRGARVHAFRARRLTETVGTAQQRQTLQEQLPDLIEWTPATRSVEGAARLDIDWLNHLFTVAQHPLLLAEETIEALRGLPRVAAAHVVLANTDVPPRGTRPGFGPITPAPDWHAVTWTLGDTRDGLVQVRLWLRDAAGQADLATLGDLVAAAVALADRRQREGSLVAGWDASPPDTPVFGVFGPSMRTQIALLRQAAVTTLPVLVTGETGTGKELVARELHRLARAATGAFVPFNCAAIPRDMLESQLFGHRRGAFTGAAADFRGLVGEAAGGTLFLDEIGELDLTLQPKLLRFLETGEVQRLGDARPASFDVRTIAATNADVDALVHTGDFRPDLYHRLNGLRLHLPPLRDRRDDVPALARHFLERFAREAAKPPLRLGPAVIELLTIYDWPGNVRELLNEMRRLVTFLEPGTEIGLDQLSHTIRTRALETSRKVGEAVAIRVDQPMAEAVEQLQRLMVERAFRVAAGRVGDSASILGLSRKGLFLMRRRLGLE